MRNVVAAVMGGVWFALVGCLAAAAPAMTWSQLTLAVTAIVANGLWLISFTSNR